MSDPVFGYSTLQIIPSLEGAAATIDRDLSRVLGQVGPAAGKDIGVQIARGLAGADADVADAARRLTDSASSGAGQSGEELGRKIGQGIDAGLAASTAGLGADIGNGVGVDIGGDITEGLKSATAGLGEDLDRSLRGNSSGLSTSAGQVGQTAGAELAASMSDQFRKDTADLGSELDLNLGGLADASAAAGVDAGSNIGAGVLSGLAEAGVEIAGEFAELGIQAGAQGLEIGEGIGGSVSSGFAGGLDLGDVAGEALGALGPLLTNPVTIIGAGAGALFAKGFADAINFDGVQAKLEASLGATDAEAAKLGNLTQDLFRGNYGDSIEQTAEAVTLITKNFEGARDASTADLDAIAKMALTTAGVFDQDLGGSINAASQLIRTGLAADANDAFDIITAGLQGSANKADDLLEVFNEYSTQFRELGLNGKDALGLIQQGVEAGARDADVAADALKEFAIRAQDGSKTTVEGFEAIGLNAQLMAERIAGGGAGARQALDDTFDGLRRIEDPAERSAVTLKLFGTQAEDLGDALAAMDLDTAAEGLGDISQKAEEASKSFESMASNWERVKRTLFGVGADTANEILDPLAGALSSPNENMSLWQQYGDDAANAVIDSYRYTFGSLFAALPGVPDPSRLDFSGSGAESDFSFKTKADADAADRLAARITEAKRAAADAGPVTKSYGDSLEYAADRAKLMAAGVDSTKAMVEGFQQSISGSTSLDDLLSSALDVQDAMSAVFGSIGGLGDVDISDIADGITGASEQARAALGDIASAGDAAQQAITTALEFRGADAAVATADRIRDGLLNVFDAAGLSDEQIAELLASMGLLPPQIDTAITVSGTEKALADLEAIKALVANPDPTVPAGIQAQISLELNEGDLETAANLQAAFILDLQDGALDNPLLLALQLGDTTPVSEGVRAFRDSVSQGPPAEMPIGANTLPAIGSVDAFLQSLLGAPPTLAPVGANTIPAETGVNTWGNAQQGKTFTLGVDADMSKAEKTIRNFFGSGTLLGLGVQVAGARAGGGPIRAGDTYLVGEKEAELFTSNRDGWILNQEQIAAAQAQAGSSGRSGDIWNIYETTSARDTAETTARLIRRER